MTETQGGVETSVEEKRIAPRERVFLTGVLLIPGEDAARPATILNRSSTGAKIRICDEGAVPSAFTLVDQRAALAHVCRVVWRAMPDVGVAFEKTVDLSRDEGGASRRLHRS